MLNQPFREVKAFVKRQAALGKYKGATAANLEAACTRIEGILEAGKDTVGFVQEHVDELVARYGNLNPKVGKGSLDTYRARLSRAVEDFIAHKTDPQWQPPSRSRSSTRGKVTNSGTPNPTAAPPPDIEVVPGPAQSREKNALRHRLPLRPDFDVEVLLPRDFNSKEAKRVSTWIAALVGEPDDAA